MHNRKRDTDVQNSSEYSKAETSIFWPPDTKNCLIGKYPDAGKNWRWEEKGMTEDEMVGWHHWLNGHEFEQALGAGDAQGSLACCSPWGHKELDMTERLNWITYWGTVRPEAGLWEWKTDCKVTPGFSTVCESVSQTSVIVQGSTIVLSNEWNVECMWQRL